MSQLSKRIIGVVVILAIIVVAAAWFWKQGAEDRVNNFSAVNQAAPPADPVKVAVDDQFPGSVVFVSGVDLPQGGWVVIRQDENGAPGAIIGAGYFEAGVKTGEINLSRATAESERYYAVLYQDNGDLNFDARSDLAYRDAGGQLVMSAFLITKNLPEKKG